MKVFIVVWILLPLTPSSFGVGEEEGVYASCVDSWIGNTRSSCTDCRPVPFNKNYFPSKCLEECQGRGMTVGLLKGGECLCTSIGEYLRMRIMIKERCNIPCPVSTFHPQLPPPAPSQACGGDRTYSAFCKPTPQEDCSSFNQDEERIIRESEGMMVGEWFKGCAKCPSTSNCQEWAISPSYDYFPTLEPLHCKMFCGSNVTYTVTSGGSPGESIQENRVRPPTRYALLMWDRRYGSPLPICKCTDSLQSFSILPSSSEESEESQACHTPCPGDEMEMCGNDDRSGAVYASVYCNFEDCLDPNLTPTSSPPTTVTVAGDESDCSTTATPTTTPVYTTPTSTPPDTSCGVKCVGRDLIGREWEVCGGEVMKKDCGGRGESEGEAMWECSLEGHFVTEHPLYSHCHSQWVEELVKQSEQVNDTKSAVSYLGLLGREMRGRGEYFGHEIKIFSSLLKKVVGTATDTTQFSSEFEEVAVGAISVSAHLLTTPHPWHQLSKEERSMASTHLIKVVEETSLNLTFKVGPGEELYSKTLSDDPNYFVWAGALRNSKNSSLQFPPLLPSLQDSYMILPSGWSSLGEEGGKVGYVGLQLHPQFANLILPGQFQSLDLSTPPEGGGVRKVMNSKLLSFSVGHTPIKFPGKGVEVHFQHELEAWGDKSLNLKRKLHHLEKPGVALGTAKCVYWDTKDLIWSTNGCKIVSSSKTETVCECSHLTSFAILMDPHNYLGKDLGLEILTIILCAFSFMALFVSIVVFCTFQGIQSERNSITKNLGICLLIGNTFVLLILDRNYFNLSQGACAGSGMLTHYIFLAAFGWMGVEGVHLYRMVVHVFDSEKNPLRLYRLVSYGIPLIIVLFTAMIGYLRGHSPYGGDVFCWLDGNYIWAFLAPLLLVVVMNLIILFIALKTAYEVQYNSQRKSQATPPGRASSFRRWLRGCLSLTVLLGVSWLVGFFALVPETGVVAAYIFTILNASQGMFIFLFHCVYNEKIRQVTYQRMGNYFPSWISSSTNSSFASQRAGDSSSKPQQQSSPQKNVCVISTLNRRSSLKRSGSSDSSLGGNSTDSKNPFVKY